MSEISLLVINYRSAELTRVAVESARSTTSAALEVVIVDNTGSDEEIDALIPSNAKIVRAPRNLGYGGAINLGATQCSAQTLVVANPDVVFHDRCIDELAAGLGRFDMTGPRIAWDSAGRWVLPPADAATARAKWREAVAGYSFAAQRRFDRERTLRRIGFWSAATPLRVDAISGAAMCFRRELLSRVGPFDERFHLYFEEIDFMRRMTADGLAVGMIPAAHCRHMYSQTTASTDARDEAYARSEELYFGKWSPHSWRLAKRFGRALRALPVDHELGSRSPIRLPSRLVPERTVVEISPLASFFTAAGHFPSSEEVALPPEVLASLREDTLFARVVERSSGRVERVIRVRKNE